MEFIQNIDNVLLEFIRTHMSFGILDQTMPFVTRLGSGGLIWIITAFAFMTSKKYRMDGLLLISSLLLCALIGNMTLKPLVARIRPFYINKGIPLLIPGPTDFSFPSGHTMSSFAAATVIFHANSSMGAAAFILASLIAFSRLYLYVHYPSDIAAGIAIGVFISTATIWLFKARMKRGSSTI